MSWTSNRRPAGGCHVSQDETPRRRNPSFHVSKASVLEAQESLLLLYLPCAPAPCSLLELSTGVPLYSRLYTCLNGALLLYSSICANILGPTPGLWHFSGLKTAIDSLFVAFVCFLCIPVKWSNYSSVAPFSFLFHDRALFGITQSSVIRLQTVCRLFEVKKKRKRKMFLKFYSKNKKNIARVFLFLVQMK
jgi:hypothetical protein